MAEVPDLRAFIEETKKVQGTKTKNSALKVHSLCLHTGKHLCKYIYIKKKNNQVTLTQALSSSSLALIRSCNSRWNSSAQWLYKETGNEQCFSTVISSDSI